MSQHSHMKATPNKLIQELDKKFKKKIISKFELSPGLNIVSLMPSKNPSQSENIITDSNDLVSIPISIMKTHAQPTNLEEHSNQIVSNKSGLIIRANDFIPIENDKQNDNVELNSLCDTSHGNIQDSSNLVQPHTDKSDAASNQQISDANNPNNYLKNEIELFESLSASSKAKYFKSLENTIGKCVDTIEMIDQMEFTMDDLDDTRSLWIQESRYIKKLNRIHRLENKLKHIRTKRKRKVFILGDDSIFPFLKRDVEMYVNGRLKRKILNLINYDEILQVTKNSCDANNIKLSADELRVISGNIFRKVGNELQKRRIDNTLEYLNNCIITADNPNIPDSINSDPADNDLELSAKLSRNEELCRIKMNSIKCISDENIIENSDCLNPEIASDCEKREDYGHKQ